VELDSQEREGGIGQPGMAGGTEQPREHGRKKTARRGQAEQNSQERAGGTEQPGEGRQNWTARGGHAELNGQESADRTGQPGEGRRNWTSRNGTGGTGQPGIGMAKHDSWNGIGGVTARTGQQKRNTGTGQQGKGDCREQQEK
jgi:hypothetical protein